MSSGPGILQQQILKTLEEKSKVSHRILLWELALSRNEIIRTGKKWGNIEEGHLKKSFIENFMRAFKGLAEAGKIKITKEKLTDINTFIGFIPYITIRLELYQLGVTLLPTIQEYIEQEKPSILSKYGFDFESYQIEELRRSEGAEFRSLKHDWTLIEQKIMIFLSNEETVNYDLWLNLIIQGRFLFRGRTEWYKDPMFITKNRLAQKSSNMVPSEIRLLEAIDGLIKKIAKNVGWQIGEIKNVLYAFCEFSKYSKAGLTDEFKNYLFKRQPEIMKKLPAHEEPSPRVMHRLYLGEKHRKFSTLLDQLITRHILREQYVLHQVPH